jgi:hypothetical protein
MQAHIIDAPDTRGRPVAPPVSGEAVRTVGTFAAGQAARGTFHVAAEAEVGSFASGLADDESTPVPTEEGRSGAA